MSSPIKLGVVGLGRMGLSYCQIVAQMRGVVLAGVVDTSAETREAVSSKFTVPAYEQTTDLLTKGVDGVIIATPDEAHMMPTVEALDANVNVFVEKPLATTMEDARKIATAAKRSAARTLVGHVCRFDPAYVAAQGAIAKGNLGNIKYIYARRTSTPATLLRMEGRVSCAAYLGIHDVDLMEWILNAGVRRVTSKRVQGPLSGIDADALIVSIFEFDDGSLGVLENSWLRPDGPTVDKTAWMHIQGDQGIAEIQPFVAATRVTGELQTSTHNQVYLDSATAAESGGLYAAEIEHFIAVIEGRDEPRVSVDAGLRAVRIISAIEKSLESEQSVEVDLL